jgi:3-methyladenine DNA glycosylase AlkD
MAVTKKRAAVSTSVTPRQRARVSKRVPTRKPAGKRVEARDATPTVTNAQMVLANLSVLADAAKARVAQGFFKTGAGEYGEVDQFLGIRLPVLRGLARDFRDVGLDVALPLLKSSWHEARSLGLMLMIKIFQRGVQSGDEATQKKIYDLYLKHTDFINNWDLVDLSAEHIVGRWLADKSRAPLTKLAKSKSVWERRIAILATFHYIKKGDYAETLRIARLLLKDEEDLIQKAVGWMLREVGKRVSQEAEESFLQRYYREMPRTMLRYAIERFAEPKRKAYLRGDA